MARLKAASGASIAFAACVLFAAVVALLTSCGGRETRLVVSAGKSSAGVATGSGYVSSNVLFADYAGTQACAKCHAERVRTWLASPMHNMTRDPALADIKGPFDGTTFRFKDDTARLETVGGARFISIESKKFGAGTYRLTRVIGGHHREDYAGILVASARAEAAPLSSPPEELVLPVSWVFAPPGTTAPAGATATSAPGAPGALRYKGYSVMVKERPGLHAGPVWNQTCIFCHNTPAYLSTVLGALAGPAAKPYQGEVVDPLLPRDKRAEWVVTDAPALSSALETELARIGVKRSHPTPLQAIAATRSAFRREHLVELGIGCEACHLGSAEHVRDPQKLPSLEPRSAFFSVKLPPPANEGAAQLRATRINRTCARCHQVLFSGYEPTWEGGNRHGNAGGSHINSGEARDMMLGACASKLSCVECHDPHRPDATAELRALVAVQQDALCTKCHERYASADALRAHAHHDPAGEGGRCLSCHMPKKNLALDGTLSRYHRIGSPNDPQRVLLDRPMECALCHADKSVESLAITMETWWKRPFDRDALRLLYGALDANVLLATAERGKPHEQAVAFYLLGEARAKLAIPILASQLTHPYPLVRGYAKRALDRAVGAPVAIDIDAEDADIDAAAKAWLARPR
jgi:predicted CXXCH cytochrome family protein